MRALKDDFQRILILKPSSFGDVIHALPVLNGLRQRYPGAHIAWLVASSCAGLLDGHPALSEIIRFDRRRFGRLGRSWAVTAEFVAFLEQLRARRFDLVLDLQGLFRSGFLARATGAAVRVGFASARELAWAFYTHRVPVPDREMHAVDRNYLFGRLLGFADVPIAFELPVKLAARAAAEASLADAGIAPGQPYILIGPGTRWETKLWPADFFAQLARQIEGETGCRVVLTGMAGEVAIAEEVVRRADSGLANLAGRTALPELIALVAGASMVVMHDSGPMHLATALGKPMVAIYGPTSPRRTGPYRRPEAVARLDLPCSPCYLKRLAECPYGHRCMRDLTPEQLMPKVMQIMQGIAR